jgi:dimethylargininase
MQKFTRMIALTRDVSDALAHCELTYLDRQPIDVARARGQHQEYERVLATAAHCAVVRVPAAPDLPDAVFIEDTAVVVDEVAVITRPGAESRRRETTAVADVLKEYRELRRIEAPGTLDGGDVLLCGRRAFIGRTSRTNDGGIAQMQQVLAPFGYTTHAVTVRGCLHLKSAATALAEDQLLVNPAWISRDDFPGVELFPIDPAEPDAANILKAGDHYLYSPGFPRTAARLQVSLQLNFVDMSELAKAEGAMTCGSLILRDTREK